MVTPPSGKGYSREVGEELVGRIRQALDEQLVSLADGASLSRRARELLVDRAARVDDKAGFDRDCPNPESASTLVLGCYTGTSVLADSGLGQSRLKPALSSTRAARRRAARGPGG